MLSCRVDIRDLGDLVVDAKGHMGTVGVSAIIRRVRTTAYLPSYDEIVSDSIFNMYGDVGGGRPGIVSRVSDVDGVPVRIQGGRGFACTKTRGGQSRFQLPSVDRVLVISAGNDLFVSTAGVANEIRQRVSAMKALWAGEESFVDVLILEDNTWPSSQSESELSE